MSRKDRSKKRKAKKFLVPNKGLKALRQGIYHPSPGVQRKCFAVLLLSFLLSASLVAIILDISTPSVRTYWKAYKKGGVKALKKTVAKEKKALCVITGKL